MVIRFQREEEMGLGIRGLKRQANLVHHFCQELVSGQLEDKMVERQV